MPPGLHRLWLGVVSCHLIEDDAGCVLIDTGLVGAPTRLRRHLARRGRRWEDVRAILLTHGHLDHAGGLARIKRLTGATVYAHPEEQAHVDGRYPYRGLSRVCGILEGLGRPLLRYQPVTIDEAVSDGQVLALAGGMRVIHLPGHTRGHCGFHWLEPDLLFVGDALLSAFWGTSRPYAIFNSQPDAFAKTFERIAELNPAMIVPNHYDVFDGCRIKQRVDRFLRRRTFLRRPGRGKASSVQARGIRHRP